MRALAVARYLAVDVLRSQRFLLPLLAYAAVLAILFGGDPGPPPVPWAASALALYAVGAWWTVIVANAVDPVRRSVLAVEARGRGAVAAGVLIVALAGNMLLGALSVLVPALLNRYPHPAPALVLGGAAHLACAATATAVGLLCARPIVGRIGVTSGLTIVVVVLTAVQPWLPPVGTAVASLTEGGAAPVAAAVTALVLATAAAVVSWAVDRRA